MASALLVGADRLPQFQDSLAGSVLVGPRGDGLPGCRLHLLRAVLVGEPLAEVDRSGLQGQRGHLFEDRHAQGPVFREQVGARGRPPPRGRVPVRGVPAAGELAVGNGAAGDGARHAGPPSWCRWIPAGPAGVCHGIPAGDAIASRHETRSVPWFL